jgi:uncharacterized protein YbjT (DUF2867 family)
MARICVLGGTGFIGRHLLNRLVARGDKVVVPTRRLSHARELYPLPGVDVVPADIHEDATLGQLVRGCDAAINLVGILYSRPARSPQEPYGPDFAKVHVELPRRFAEAAARAGVEHLLHVSAVGAGPDAPSEYLRSKAAGGEAVLAARDHLNATVFRPSVVFGPEDRFLNLFADLQRLFPVVFLACPEARFQPVFVEDVAAVMARALFDRSSYHREFELCGPSTYTLRELVEYAGRASGHPRPVIGLSEGLSQLQARVMECLPVKLLTRDAVRSMKIDSVGHSDFPYGMHPAALEAIAPAYLGGRDPKLRLYNFRSRAGR